MAFGILYPLTATGTVLPVTDAIDAPARGHGYDRADRRTTAAYGVDFVMSPPPPKTLASKKRLCNNRVTAQAAITAGNIPATGRNAAETPRNLLYMPYCVFGTSANRFFQSRQTYETFVRTLNEAVKKYSVKPPKHKHGERISTTLNDHGGDVKITF